MSIRNLSEKIEESIEKYVLPYKHYDGKYTLAGIKDARVAILLAVEENLITLKNNKKKMKAPYESCAGNLEVFAMSHELTKRIKKHLGTFNFEIALENEITSWLKAKAEEIKLGMKEKCAPFIEEILGLQESPTPKRSEKWCIHIIERFSNAAQKKLWFFKPPSMPHADCLADDFKQCPICAAPRPT